VSSEPSAADATPPTPTPIELDVPPASEPHRGFFAIKRATDVVGAKVVLILTAPIWIVAILVLHLNTTGGPAFKHPQDPRLTRIGKWLRAYSIDELPQAWNILRGDMALVGPRALPIVENVYEGRQAERLSVPPGLTCTWQVSGRSEITFDRWMEMDLEYVDHRTIWRDIVLLARTPLAVLGRRGAM